MNSVVVSSIRLLVAIGCVATVFVYNAPDKEQSSSIKESTLLSFFPTCDRNETSTAAFKTDDSQFPPDAFSLDERQRGAGMNMHLSKKLSISDDVAGATFMAAGGSAPEFFTSVIGVFIAQNNVGIGTIVEMSPFIFWLFLCLSIFFMDEKRMILSDNDEPSVATTLNTEATNVQLNGNNVSRQINLNEYRDGEESVRIERSQSLRRWDI
uniref:Na_Ca_ex domain-containing protein n=1 Tax=Heterorhabditis bacteriophora TaxID=37862 RepID=A0A1I7WVU5_HETBA